VTRKSVSVAIAYDFDGTLSPGNMQEYEFVPDIGMTPKKFWNYAVQQAKQNEADSVLTYMNLMLKKAAEKGILRWTPSLGQDKGCTKSGYRYPQGV